MDDLDAIERFTGLYDRYKNRVYAYAVSRAGRQLADEVVSEVFLVAWRRLDELPVEPLPWLLVTARNVIGSEFRAAARQESLAAELSSWGSGVASDIADQVSERQAVLRALAAMPEADRELLTLSAWHGLSPRDAASVAGCSAATYFVRLHRARRRLEKAMADSPESEPRHEIASQKERHWPQRRSCPAPGPRHLAHYKTTSSPSALSPFPTTCAGASWRRSTAGNADTPPGSWRNCRHRSPQCP